MDNRDSCALDKKNTDTTTVWQWRIMHVKKHLGFPEPFHYSNKIGLDLNVAESKQKKRDLQLVTNGAILEVCDFAETVSKGEKHFLTNILENNFDLGLENEQQRIDFTTHILCKVKDLLRNPPGDEQEVFTLFDTSEITSNDSNCGPKESSGEQEAKIDDTHGIEHEDEFQHKDEVECSLAQSAKELKGDSLLPSFPYCEEIGLKLGIGSKQSLDPNLLTKGVMLELLHFTRVLTSSSIRIILDVLEHNFDLNLKDEQVKNRVWCHVSDLLERRKRFNDKPFSFQSNPLKRPSGPALPYKGIKRLRTTQAKHKKTKTLSHYTKLCTRREAEDDSANTSPWDDSDLDSNELTTGDTDTEVHFLNMDREKMVTENNCGSSVGESDRDSNEFKDSGKTSIEDNLEKTKTLSLSIPKDSSKLQTLFSNIDPPFGGDEKRLCEQEQIPRCTPKEQDMEHEELQQENLWKLRANRVEEILFLRKKYQFRWLRKYGLSFNVGFDPKQNISTELLSNHLLFEIAKFALALSSSQQDFIMEILEFNFDLTLQSQHDRNTFICEVINRLRQLRSCEDVLKCSNEVFELPVPMQPVNMANPNVVIVIPELSGIIKKEKDDVTPLTPSHATTQGHTDISCKRVDLYPCCQEINLQLHVNNSQPRKKLDIKKLTNGAMAEVETFAEELCGSFEQICLDVLKQNFDLDLENRDSDQAKNVLAQIYAAVEQRKLSTSVKGYNKIKRLRKDISTTEELDSRSNPNLDACRGVPCQESFIDQHARSSADSEQKSKLNLFLWKLRANHIQRILSIPHEERCLLYSYSRCKKLGIDFNVGSGVKQNLDPKLLTNGIMVEFNSFFAALESSRNNFVTEILEYNFHIKFKNELHRWAFGHQTYQKFGPCLSYKKFSTILKKTHFPLPDSTCINEPTYDETIYCPKCYRDRHNKLYQDESDANHSNNHHAHSMTGTKHATDPSSTTIEESLMDVYPLCRSIGLSLCVDKKQPKDKLDPQLLTYGIMKEMFMFAKRLCGTKTVMINALLGHNFNIDKRSLNEDVPYKFRRALERNDGGLDWFSEVFVIQPVSCRQTGNFLTFADVSSNLTPENPHVKLQFGYPPDKRGQREDVENTPTPRNYRSKCLIYQEDIGIENYYTCPLGESDLDSDEVTESCNMADQDPLQNHRGFSQSSDCVSELELNCPDVSVSSLNSRNISSNLPTVNSNMDPPCVSQSDEKGLSGGEEQMSTLKNLWKLRANRVKQILSRNKEFGLFFISKKYGLEFNIGYGPKQNISLKCFTDPVLIEIAKFAIAINSSQQDFIMQILEYNFDLSLQGQRDRNTFMCEIMNRLRQLRSCEDSLKCPNEVFELPAPVPPLTTANRNVVVVIPELSSITKNEKEDAGPIIHPHATTKGHTDISCKRVDLYPCCQEINLQLHVNNSQPRKKLDMKILTNGAMAEVETFAEELCGTLDQICLDIVKHNFVCDLQNEDSDLAKNLLTQIPFAVQKRNLRYVKHCKNQRKWTRNISIVDNLGYQDKPDVEAHRGGSSQTANLDENEGSSTELQHKNQLKAKLWKLRVNRIQQILSIPHEEQCPFYSYPRCKKLGIDFNVGSEIKQNLEPKLLTNGIMVELYTFASTLVSATRDFIAEILEYNFNLKFKNELYRSAFARQIMLNRQTNLQKRLQKERLYELPDMRSIPELIFDKSTYCPKCYLDRNQKLHQGETDNVCINHQHALKDTVTADENCKEQKPAMDPSPTSSRMEEIIMDHYPHCKEIGLNLCVDTDKPKDKLDSRVLTHEVMNEVECFARKLCGIQNRTVCDLVEHNFRMDFDIQQLANKQKDLKEDGPDWFNQVFVVRPISRKPQESKVKPESSLYIMDRKETIQRRKLALQKMEKKATLTSHKVNAIKPRKNPISPLCTKIGLDLDITSKSGEKEKLDLKLLTIGVVFEIHTFAAQKVGQYLSNTLFDILDYNFDLSSQYYRRWEFSIATLWKVQELVKRCHLRRERGNQVFELPFVFPSKRAKNREEKQEKTCNKYSQLEPQKGYHLDVKTEEDTFFQTDPWTMNKSLVSADCVSPLQGSTQLKDEYDPHYGSEKLEPQQTEDVKLESNTLDVEHLLLGEPADTHGDDLATMWPVFKSHIETEPQNEGHQYFRLIESQGSDGHTLVPACSSNEGNIRTEFDMATEQLHPLEAAASQGTSLITMDEVNVPAGSHYDGVTEDEEGNQTDKTSYTMF